MVGNFGDAVALSFAPQSVVTPLGSFSIVANSFTAKVLLKERFCWRTALGSGIIILGVVAIVLPSSQSIPDCAVDEVTLTLTPTLTLTLTVTLTLTLIRT